MSQRLQIVLPDPVATQLHELAAGTGEPPVEWTENSCPPARQLHVALSLCQLRVTRP